MFEVSPELFARYPVLMAVFNVVTILFYFVVIWVFARMGDNINKIRRMLEHELKKRNTSQ